MKNIKIGTFKEDSKFKEIDILEFGKYLAEKSEELGCVSKRGQNHIMYFSTNGKVIGIAFYVGASKKRLKIFVLRDI